MTKEKWLEQLIANRQVLIKLIGAWHPANKQLSRQRFPITAPATEHASVGIRNAIAKETVENPVQRFQKAIQEQDHQELYNVLQEAWFGVPESTSCWDLVGFSEAVALVEDPVEEDEPDQID